MNYSTIVRIILIFPLLLVKEVCAQDMLKILEDKFGKSSVVFKDSSAFKEYYQIQFHQPVDHFDLSKGYFNQLILLGHNDATKPMIMETNGYEILPYQNLEYVSEPTKMLNGNQIIVEHRYYGNSIPDSNNNAFLNFKQSTADYHNIKKAFSDIYKSEWVSTGASKGGNAAVNYSYYYPKDMDASFVYVAPIIRGLQDERITSYLRDKRSGEIGQKLFTIQKELLERKQMLLPVFLDILKFSHLEIGTMDPETLYDFAVLEFDFSFWQYISDFYALTSYNKRLLVDMTNRGLQNTSLLVTQSDSMIATFPACIWYLLDHTLAEPFFYQAFTQMGTYGYEEELFEGLKYSTYSTEFLAGEHPDYEWKYVRAFNRFLKSRLKNTIFIYGGEDPWTACKPDMSRKSDNLIIVNSGTNLSTLIKDVDEAEKEKVKVKLNQWLKSETNIN